MVRRPVEVFEVADGVQLYEVYAVHAQALQRGLDLSPRRVFLAQVGLGGEEYVVPYFPHPAPAVELGVAVAGGGVEVIDPGLQSEGDRLVRLLLGDFRQGELPVAYSEGSVLDATFAGVAPEPELLDSSSVPFETVPVADLHLRPSSSPRPRSGGGQVTEASPILRSYGERYERGKEKTHEREGLPHGAYAGELP